MKCTSRKEVSTFTEKKAASQLHPKLATVESQTTTIADKRATTTNTTQTRPHAHHSSYSHVAVIITNLLHDELDVVVVNVDVPLRTKPLRL